MLVFLYHIVGGHRLGLRYKLHHTLPDRPLLPLQQKRRGTDHQNADQRVHRDQPVILPNDAGKADLSVDGQANILPQSYQIGVNEKIEGQQRRQDHRKAPQQRHGKLFRDHVGNQRQTQREGRRDRKDQLSLVAGQEHAAEQDQQHRNQKADPTVLPVHQKHGQSNDSHGSQKAQSLLFDPLAEHPDKLHGDYRAECPGQMGDVLLIRVKDQGNGNGEAERQKRQVHTLAPENASFQFFVFLQG